MTTTETARETLTLPPTKNNASWCVSHLCALFVTKILQKQLFMMPMRVAVDIGERTLTAASTDLFDESAFLLNDEILQPLRVGCGDRCAVNTSLWTIQDPSGRCKRWCASVLAPALAAENFRSATRASGSQTWLI